MHLFVMYNANIKMKSRTYILCFTMVQLMLRQRSIFIFFTITPLPLSPIHSCGLMQIQTMIYQNINTGLSQRIVLTFMTECYLRGVLFHCKNLQWGVGE